MIHVVCDYIKTLDRDIPAHYSTVFDQLPFFHVQELRTRYLLDKVYLQFIIHLFLPNAKHNAAIQIQAVDCLSHIGDMAIRCINFQRNVRHDGSVHLQWICQGWGTKQ